MTMRLRLGRCPRVPWSAYRGTESFANDGVHPSVEWTVASLGRAAFLAVAVLLFAVACDDPTQPIDRPRVTEINTVAIEVTGALELEAVLPASGAFQFVGDEGVGVRIAASPGSVSRASRGDVPVLPPGFFAIHLPGRPEAGDISLGDWDPMRDGETQGGRFVVRPTTVSFGDAPAVLLDIYASLGGGVVDVESITFPEYLDTGSPGSIRGRVATRAAANELLTDPRLGFGGPDTIDIAAEFWVELPGWYAGAGAVSFADGGMADVSVPELTGWGSNFSVGADETERLLVSLTDASALGDDRLELWFGTGLREPGDVSLEAIPLEDIETPANWPDHFVAGSIGGRDFGSLSGTIEIEGFDGREVTGRLNVELGVEAVSGGEPEQTTAELIFRVPVANSVEFND